MLGRSFTGSLKSVCFCTELALCFCYLTDYRLCPLWPFSLLLTFLQLLVGMATQFRGFLHSSWIDHSGDLDLLPVHCFLPEAPKLPGVQRSSMFRLRPLNLARESTSAQWQHQSSLDGLCRPSACWDDSGGPVLFEGPMFGAGGDTVCVFGAVVLWRYGRLARG